VKSDPTRNAAVKTSTISAGFDVASLLWLSYLQSCLTLHRLSSDKSAQRRSHTLFQSHVLTCIPHQQNQSKPGEDELAGTCSRDGCPCTTSHGRTQQISGYSPLKFHRMQVANDQGITRILGSGKQTAPVVAIVHTFEALATLAAVESCVCAVSSFSSRVYDGIAVRRSSDIWTYGRAGPFRRAQKLCFMWLLGARNCRASLLSGDCWCGGGK
jgi:hypothetical protein